MTALFWKDFTIYMHGIIMALAILLAVLLFILLRKKQGAKLQDTLSYIALALPFSLILSRVYYCYFGQALFQENPASVFDLSKGGYSLYGALAGVLAAILIYALRKKDHIPELLDAASVAISAAIAVGRLSAYFSGEEQGYVIENPALQKMPFGIFNTQQQAWCTAVFFFEAFAAALIFILLLIFFLKKQNKKGYISLLFCILYGFSQIFFESMRSDSLYLVTLGFVRVSQVISALIAVTCLIILLIRYAKQKKLSAVQPIIWFFSILLFAVAFYCEFRMNAQVLVRNYVIMGLCLSVLCGEGIFLYYKLNKH